MHHSGCRFCKRSVQVASHVAVACVGHRGCTIWLERVNLHPGVLHDVDWIKAAHALRPPVPPQTQ
jgi:hypothetical protein